MKRKKTLLIAGGALVALVAAIGIESVIQKHVDDIQTTDEVIIQVVPENLSTMSWEYEGNSLEFKQEDGTWYSTDDSEFPVDQDEIADFLSNFEEVHASFIIDDVEDYSQYGLSEPQCTIEMATEEDALTISLGDYSPMDSKRYVSIGDGRVFLIDDDLLEYITTDRDDFMENDNIPYYSYYESIEVSGANNLDIVYEPDEVYTYTDTNKYYLLEDDSHKALSTNLVKSFISNLTQADLLAYETYTADEEALAEYGLDDPALTIAVKEYEDPDSDSSASTDSDSEEETPNSYTVTIGRPDENSSTCYLRYNDSSIIYIMDSSLYDTLTEASYDTLRPTAVVLMDWSQVSAVDLTIDGENYTVDFTAGRNETTYAIGEEEVDFSAVTDAIDALSISEFSEEEPAKSEEITVTIHQDNEDYPEVSFTIYQYDGENCLVTFDGQPMGLVERSLAVDLTEAVNTIVLGLE